MKLGGGGTTTGAFADRINSDFGSFDKFKEALKTAGGTQLGSGWAWLLLENGTLKVTKTLNAQTPLHNGQIRLLTMDFGEPAYYLDYQNKPPDYVDASIPHSALQNVA